MAFDLTYAKVLVTGGAGFMGSAFIRVLLSQEDFKGRVLNLDSLSYAGNLHNLASVEEDPRYSFLKGDIGDASTWEKISPDDVDVIVHFAAETHVDRSIHDPKSFITTNVLGTWAVLDWVKKHPHIHFHHISTDEVYGALENEGVFTEESTYSPNSPYSASKAASDHFVHAFHKTYGLSTTISHSSNNYGPYQFPEKFIPHMILGCMQKRALPVYGKGSNIRDWIHVEDHARAVLSILKHGTSGEVYNIGVGVEKTNLEVLREILAIYSNITGDKVALLESLITFVKDRPGHDFRYAVSTSKITSETGWKSQIDFSTGLYQTVKWYLENSFWVQNVLNGDYRNWVAKQYSGAV